MDLSESRQIDSISFAEALKLTEQSPATGIFLGVPVGHSGAYAAKDFLARAVLLIEADDALTKLSLRIGRLSIQTGLKCTVTADWATPIEAEFHVVRCDSGEPEVNDAFFAFGDVLADRIGRHPVSTHELVEFCRKFQSIFQASDSPGSRATLQGLWGELFFIQRSGASARWLGYWHQDPYRRWDFSSKDRHIEVKTSRSGSRSHLFSHRQLTPAASETVVVLSILVSPVDDGLSLYALVNELQCCLDGDVNAVCKLQAALRAACYSRERGVNADFAPDSAAASFRWYRVEALPHFSEPEPLGVTETQYRVDLDQAIPMGTDEVGEWLALWNG